MKISAASVLALALAAPVVAYTQVNIKADCKGLNTAKLSVQEKTLLGHVLQDTYNEVHGNADDDDSELTNVHWGSVIGTNLVGLTGYSGDWNCHLCPKKDDDAMLGAGISSGPANKLWEAKLVQGLADTGYPTFSKLTKCSINMGPLSLEEQQIVDDTPSSSATMNISAASDLALVLAAPLVAFTQVNIKADCKGLNTAKLSVQEKTLLGHVLQDTYNEVHGNADDDDSELTNVHWGSVIGTNLVGLTGYSGDWNCHLCPKKDDDAMLGAGIISGPANRLWEAKLVEGLVDTGYPTFSKLTKCSINMGPLSLEEQQIVEDTLSSHVEPSTAATPVKIALKCKGVDFAKLNVADITFAGNVLEDSFNTVHGQSDNDDSELSNTHWGSYSSSDTLQLTSGYSGDWNCHLCPKKDDDFVFAVGSTGAALKKWESEFVVGLVASGRPAFQNIGTCDIKMDAKGTAVDATVVGEATKCGLRACAEE